LNRYNGRPALHAFGVKGAPTKEPESEAETALLLQAMISSEHPGIDFVIGDYNTSAGVDLLVEKLDKGIRTEKWAELVSSLENLFAWEHPPLGIHIVVCYTLGRVKEHQKFTDGTEARLVTKTPGRYALIVGEETIDVYVLREILEQASRREADDTRLARTV